jgi:hypothetical protein
MEMGNFRGDTQGTFRFLFRDQWSAYGRASLTGAEMRLRSGAGSGRPRLNETFCHETYNTDRVPSVLSH